MAPAIEFLGPGQPTAVLRLLQEDQKMKYFTPAGRGNRELDAGVLWESPLLLVCDEQ